MRYTMELACPEGVYLIAPQRRSLYVFRFTDVGREFLSCAVRITNDDGKSVRLKVHQVWIIFRHKSGCPIEEVFYSVKTLLFLHWFCSVCSLDVLVSWYLVHETTLLVCKLYLAVTYF